MDLIEAYYAVAADLNCRGRQLLAQADLIGQMADAMSEQRMREQPPPESSAVTR